MELDDGYKFCDDLSVIELLMIGNLLTEYEFQNNVASDNELGQNTYQWNYNKHSPILTG